MDNGFVANKALGEELKKRFKFINKAYEQILVGNYGVAKNLLGNVLYKPLSMKIVDKLEEADETKK